MTPHEAFDSWSIPTRQLTGPRKKGGLISLGGFAFQEAYACLCLARLLDPRQQVIAVRYEGAQDVDLFYSDGRERYLQLKNEPGARYTLKKLRPVLQGFAADLLDSNGNGALGFELIARSNDVDAAVERLCGGGWSEKDLGEVAALLPESVEGSPAPACLHDLGDRERRELAERLLALTTFSFGMGDEVEGILSFQSRACVELAKHRVGSADLQDAFEALRAALRPQRTYTRADVQDILKRFIGGAGIEVFGGRAEALNDALLSKAATPEEVMSFYRGEALLGWSIIAADGDIERDQLGELLDQLSAPAAGLRLVCLVAEPGAGKSTLARRAAAELHRRHGAFVIRMKAKEDADIWYRLPEFSQRVGCPFYVLADDLFRFPEVVTALGELDAGLPVTILATSRTNEYQPPLIRGEVITAPLKGPSPGEKQRILERLGKRPDELTPEQHTRLDAASQFLVLMMETSEGKELGKIVEDALRWLRAHDDPAYHAYEYVSFSYQHSLSIPESLLSRLGSQGRFYRLVARLSTRGLIFYDEETNGAVRASHSVFAAKAANYYASLRDPAIVLREMADGADPSDRWERAFVAHLLRALAQVIPHLLRAALPHVETSVGNLRRQAGIYELTIWRGMYDALGSNEDAEACIAQAMTQRAESSLDYYLLHGLYLEHEREREALPLVAEWLKTHPYSDWARDVYLSLVSRYSTREEGEKAVEVFGTWVAQHPNKSQARVRYLSLVEERGERGQAARALQETVQWLAQRPNATAVRAKYLSLVELRGGDEQIENAIRETGEWLEQHPDETHVRAGYIGLVARRGSRDQINRLIRETGGWLAQHPDDDHIRGKYFSLMDSYGSPAQAIHAIKEASEWLMQHPDDSNVRPAFLSLVESHGGRDIVQQVIEETWEWLAQHPDDSRVREKFIGLTERRGDARWAVIAIGETAAWLAQHTDDTQVWPPFLGLVERRGSPEQVEAALQEMREWLAQHPDDSRVRENYIGLVARRGGPELADDVIEETKAWLSAHREEKNIWGVLLALLIRSGRVEEASALAQQAISHHPGHLDFSYQYARALRGSEDGEAVRQAFEKLISDYPDNEKIPLMFAAWLTSHNRLQEARAVYGRILESHPDDFGVGYRYGRLLLKEERFADAMGEFQKVIKARREHQMAHDGLAYALSKLGEVAEHDGRPEYAARFFAHAEQEFRHAIRFAETSGQPQAIFYSNLGWFYLARGRCAEAAAAFESAIQQAPDFFVEHWGLGRARFCLGQFREAEGALMEALEQAPEVLQPPASEEIPELLRQCREALGRDVSEPKS